MFKVYCASLAAALMAGASASAVAQAPAAAPAQAAYARVDIIRDGDGKLAVIELELIEPSLWLEHSPDGGGFDGA